tara:strand:- start:4588 stop:5574 length:987 start_codon:yes stop_codon:yes gene_type:complete
MVIDFARNVNKFAVNRYCQVVPVKKMAGFYLEMTIEEAGRIQQTDLANFVWHDGQEAPEGNDGTESFEFKGFQTKRYAYPFVLGDLTIDQASWNILAHHSSIKSRQAMTARTQLAVTELTTSGNYDSTHSINVGAGGDVTGNTGNWAQSTTARQDIKRSLTFAANIILKDTLAAIELDDLILVINPELAADLTQTQEIVDHIKGSPDALAQVKGELPGQNTMYGLPDRLYGFPLVVEKTVKVTTKKGATTSRSFIAPKATPWMVARPGGLVGVADAPNFSTCVVFAQEEMTVETLRDAKNRRTMGRVVENVQAKLVAPVSGVLFNSVA